MKHKDDNTIIKCTKCGSENLAFTEGKKGNFPLWFIILFVFVEFSLIGVAIISFSKNPSLFFIFIAIVFILGIIFRMVRYSRMRKTYTKAICKDCGNIFWIE